MCDVAFSRCHTDGFYILPHVLFQVLKICNYPSASRYHSGISKHFWKGNMHASYAQNPPSEPRVFSTALRIYHNPNDVNLEVV